MVVLEAEAAIAADCLHFSSFAFDLIFQKAQRLLLRNCGSGYTQTSLIFFFLIKYTD